MGSAREREQYERLVLDRVAALREGRVTPLSDREVREQLGLDDTPNPDALAWIE
ncbi:hypothetical protein [Corynebacterium lowii]|nr:hypothetical protein [Corynebacterium lowii]MDP9851361.1 hypothetical protein [Corynebacterium lowii]